MCWTLAPVIESPTHDPVLNLEREASLTKTVEVPSFRVWRSSDSVVLGRFLVPNHEVRLRVAEELGIPVLRRTSGGGAVYHDLGNINYSIYLPDGRVRGYSIKKGLRAFSFPVTGLLDLLEVPWTWEPPNNIYVNGAKVSGSAQASSGGRLLHHGTLLVNSDLNKMSQLLQPGGRSRIAPVSNLSDVVRWLTVQEAERLLFETLSAERWI